MKPIPVTKAYPNPEEAERELAFVVQDFEQAGLVNGRDWEWLFGQPNRKRPAGWYIVRLDLKCVRNKLVPIDKTATSRHRNVKVYE